MRQLYALLTDIGPTQDPVVIVGDAGTGKELVARTLHALHAMSSRSEGRFIAFPCSAIPESLMRSELLGTEGGDEAKTDGAGCFELALGGTLFFDEITAIPMSIQEQLLGALNDRPLPRRREDDPEIAPRVVAATTFEPESAIREGTLHRDLLLRLNAFTLRLPRLRERTEDIPLLAREFVRDVALENGKLLRGIEPEAVAVLIGYSWPGNVRELRSVIERAVLQEEGEWIQKSSLAPLGPTDGIGRAQPLDPDPSEPIAQVGMTVDDATRRLILKTLEATNFNRTKAAEILGISSKTVYNKLKQWNVHGPSSPGGSEESEGRQGADSRARLP